LSSNEFIVVVVVVVAYWQCWSWQCSFSGWQKILVEHFIFILYASLFMWKTNVTLSTVLVQLIEKMSTW